MDVSTSARMKKSPEPFFATYKPGDEQRRFYGRSLLMCAIANTDMNTRYTIADFLIERDALIGPPGSEGHTPLHVLFSHAHRNVARDLTIARWLIDNGVDINATDRRGTVAMCELITGGMSDQELAPLYDLMLAQPDLDLTIANAVGRTPIDIADRLPHRTVITDRMKEYVREHA